MTSARTLVTGCSLGKYQIDSLLGGGARTEVYLATAKHSGQKVVLHVLDTERVPEPPRESAFLAAAETLASCRSEHVPAFIEAGALDGRLFLATEYIQGVSARASLLADRPFYTREFAFIQAATQTLFLAKRLGLSHGNFKADDILVPDDGERGPVILGIGSAQLFGVDRESARRTPLYRAPEQLAEASVVDERTDLYALAMVLYEFIARRPPFLRDDGALPDPRELEALVRTDYPRPLPELRKDAENAWLFIRKAISKDPRERHADLKEFHDELLTTIIWYVDNPSPSSPVIAFLREAVDRGLQIAERKWALGTQRRRAGLSRIHGSPVRHARTTSHPDKLPARPARPLPPAPSDVARILMPTPPPSPEPEPAAAPLTSVPAPAPAAAPPAPTPRSIAQPSPAPAPAPPRRDRATDPVTLPSGHLGAPAAPRDEARRKKPARFLIPAVALAGVALSVLLLVRPPKPILVARPAVTTLPIRSYLLAPEASPSNFVALPAASGAGSANNADQAPSASASARVPAAPAFDPCSIYMCDLR